MVRPLKSQCSFMSWVSGQRRENNCPLRTGGWLAVELFTNQSTPKGLLYGMGTVVLMDLKELLLGKE